MGIISNIAVGDTRRLRKPVALTILSNLVNVAPFCLVIEAVSLIFRSCSSGELDTRKMAVIIVLLILWMVVMAFAERASYRANFRGAYELSAAGRLSLAEHIRKLSLGFLSRHDPGELSSMMISDFAMAETGVSHLLPQLLGAIVMPFLAFFSLLWVDWRMSVAMFVALPVALLIVWCTNALQKRFSTTKIEAQIEAGNRLEEYLRGIRVMKAYNMLGERFARLRGAFEGYRKASLRVEVVLGPPVMLAVTVVRAGLTLMVLCGSYELVGGQLSAVTFLLFLIIGARIFDPLTSALVNIAELRHFSIAGMRIRGLMAEPEMDGKRECPDSGDIEFHNVSFAYRDKFVLSNVNLRMSRGTMTALVGPSGSGKSTILKLISRFFDPQQGAVTLGGVPLSDIRPESLMAHVSVVFQDVYLFQDTIAANIRFGRPNASDEEVVEAAKAARCHDFIMGLPNGYDTMVGEGGCTLSGGERQRISIARAILKNADIVLLDEATASLDPENELEVQHAIDQLVNGRTVVVIAHKLRTIQNADQIAVVDGGAIAEVGKHAELIERGGLYARLWKIQSEASGWSL
ncbi:MAG: ABC transporter ATP-binding protein [Marinilabiliaceae bacterium]